MCFPVAELLAQHKGKGGNDEATDEIEWRLPRGRHTYKRQNGNNKRKQNDRRMLRHGGSIYQILRLFSPLEVSRPEAAEAVLLPGRLLTGRDDHHKLPANRIGSSFEMRLDVRSSSENRFFKELGDLTSDRNPALARQHFGERSKGFHNAMR